MFVYKPYIIKWPDIERIAIRLVDQEVLKRIEKGIKIIDMNIPINAIIDIKGSIEISILIGSIETGKTGGGGRTPRVVLMMIGGARGKYMRPNLLHINLSTRLRKLRCWRSKHAKIWLKLKELSLMQVLVLEQVFQMKLNSRMEQFMQSILQYKFPLLWEKNLIIASLLVETLTK